MGSLAQKQWEICVRVDVLAAAFPSAGIWEVFQPK